VLVIARNPGKLDSNPFNFRVQNPAPVINDLMPSNAKVGTGLVTVTVNGNHFVNGAKIMWNETALPTTFVNSGQLTAQVTIGALDQVLNAGVTVLNPNPDGQSSNTATFTVQQVTAQTNTAIFLPIVKR